MLRLDRNRWPTKLNMKTELLGKLPTTSLRGPGNNTVSTGLFTLPDLPSHAGLGSIP